VKVIPAARFIIEDVGSNQNLLGASQIATNSSFQQTPIQAL
jgi:hypothetical protein